MGQSSFAAPQNESDPNYGDRITLNLNPDDYSVEGYDPVNAREVLPYLPGADHMTVIAALAKWSGIANESDFPPEAEASAIDESYRYDTGSGFVIKSAEWLNDVSEIQNWVKNYGSASLTFTYGKSDFYSKNTYVTWTAKSQFDINSAIFHEVAIIGWDNNFPMVQQYSYYETQYGAPELVPPADGAWLCKDSNECYVWISYYDASIVEVVGYTVQPSNTYRENYTYNGIGAPLSVASEGSAAIANVFKTDEYEILSAISTYTVSDKQNINIKIYTNIETDYTAPTQGTLVLDYPVFITHRGYHTITLPESIKLNANAYFSVVIEYSSINGMTRFPIEYDCAQGNINYTYSSNPGESFIYSPQKASWSYSEDNIINEQGLKNVYVQAFTNCDHRPEAKTVPSSCKEAGYTETKCMQCSEILESTVIPKREHSYKWLVDTVPTATTDGIKKQVCANCGVEDKYQAIPATGFELTNGTVINYENNTIYGLTAGINSLERYTNIVADGCEWVYEPGKYGFGTGSKAVLKNGAETINEYTVIIFGDINGDGWYNGEDAFLVNLIANGMLDKNDVDEVMWSAADCNHDGVINEADVDLLSSAGLLLNKIDQSSSPAELKSDTAYIEYISIINQSAGIDMITTNSDKNTTDISTDHIAVNSDSTKIDVTDRLSDILKAIIKILTIIFRFI